MYFTAFNDISSAFSQAEDYITYLFNYLLAEVSIQRKCEHTLADMESNGSLVYVVLSVEALKCIGNRIEILSCIYAVFSKSLEYLVSCCTEELFVEYNREISVIWLNVLLRQSLIPLTFSRRLL